MSQLQELTKTLRKASGVIEVHTYNAPLLFENKNNQAERKLNYLWVNLIDKC